MDDSKHSRNLYYQLTAGSNLLSPYQGEDMSDFWDGVIAFVIIGCFFGFFIAIGWIILSALGLA